ncbi:MAG: SnoaL-like polyketide cyclase [Solirubrobacteraceae bacterium]|nr:SnoaL-like polyketide cyclase [Solirubrobacteraceae bacterium]
MSKENLDLVRAAFDAWNSDDMGAYAALLDAGVIVRAPANWPEPGPFVGLDAVMRQFRQLRDTFDSDKSEPISDFVTVADRVVVRFAWRTVGGRGPDANMEITVVYTIRKGRVVEIEFVWDHAEVLEALGLGE